MLNELERKLLISLCVEGRVIGLMKYVGDGKGWSRWIWR